LTATVLCAPPQYLREQGLLSRLHGLEQFLAPYYGVLRVARGGGVLHALEVSDGDSGGESGCSDDDDYECLVLRDVTAGMARPCVLDVKLGRRTYEPGMSPEKQAKELAKYPRQVRTQTHGTENHRKAPQSTAKHRKAPQSTAKHRKAPQSTAKYREVPQSTAKHRKA